MSDDVSKIKTKNDSAVYAALIRDFNDVLYNKTGQAPAQLNKLKYTTYRS